MNPVIPKILANKYCGNCILSEREKLITTRNRALEFNGQHVPTSIKMLFVAESPPTKFCEQPDRYFYAPGVVRYGTLSYYTMSVLFQEVRNRAKEYFLNKFKEAGFYLIDMVKCPIDKLPKDEKAKAIASCTEYLKRELHSLKFQKVIFIGKGSFKKAERHLDLKFEPIVIPLPFGSKRNVENFKKELKRISESL